MNRVLTTMEPNAIQLHVLTNFQIFIPISGDADAFVFTQTTNPSFGLTLTRIDTNDSYHYQFQILQTATNGQDEVVSNGLAWAKRTPYQFQKKYNTSIIEALICRLKITTGVFDFRRNKDRSIRIVVRCFAKDEVLLSTGLSQTCKVLPKRRVADEEPDEGNVIIPICWALDAEGQYAASVHLQHEALYSSPEEYQDEDSVMATTLNDSEERFQSYSNDAESEDLSLIPVSHVSYGDVAELQSGATNYHSDNYMILYNGNAEVIGNFRALNFYKASDINIKEDVRLLIDDRDPRSVLLKIDGVEYKFKQGATNAPMNKRFVGYIAQQIESVVPEAVQLIDGILHVDYESLIPYLSESIKQNFRDISDMKADASQIHQVVDMMYAEFIKKEQKKNEKKTAGTKERTRNRSLRWIIGASLAVVLLISVAVGVFFIVPFVNNNQPSPNHSATPEAPSTNVPSHFSIDQDVLLDFYYATGGGKKWKNTTLPSISVCEWPGITCNEDFRVVRIEKVAGSLEGTIPDSIGKLDKLESFRLSPNMLSGTIPASIGNLTNLVALSLSNTHLSGTVPLEIFSLTSLKNLGLNNNRGLSWTIPPQISNLKRLEEFDAHGAGLHGTIPNEISELSSLTILYLGGNNLTGTVPSLEKTNIRQLQLAYNFLTGPAPKINENVLLPEGTYTSIILAQNSFSGEFDLPQEFLKDIDLLDITENLFTSVSPKFFNVTKVHAVCHAEGNPFNCPIPEWLQTICHASCK